MRQKAGTIELEHCNLHTDWFGEPMLSFAGGSQHVDPQIGIPLYGPSSFGQKRHRSEIHIGFIGTNETVESARTFMEDCAAGVPGDDRRCPFPGFQKEIGFRSDLQFSDQTVESITRQEANDILSIKNSRERFEQMLVLLEDKLKQLSRSTDHPLDYILVCLPPELVAKCKTVNYTEKGKGKIHRDLRRAFKGIAMKYGLPTQLLRLSTTDLSLDENKKVDHKSVRAWNLFTGLYFKADGLPWGPVGIQPGTCFIGISFFRPLGESSLMQTSIAQAFDENGEGLILRGKSFEWDEKKYGKTPHLPADVASELITQVLAEYKRERRQTPRRIVIHKSSRFAGDERDGFETALKGKVDEYDLVSLSQTSDVRLIRSGQYPPIRGTLFSLEDHHYLYTSGYIPSRKAYLHGHVPSPLLITDHAGDSSKVQLLKEVLTLTKMNWNSANMYSRAPITLLFSRLVGDIMRELPPDVSEPQPKYKFYI